MARLWPQREELFPPPEISPAIVGKLARFSVYMILNLCAVTGPSSGPLIICALYPVPVMEPGPAETLEAWNGSCETYP